MDFYLFDRIEYFSVSYYILLSISWTLGPLFIVRLLRAFPHYVKHGNIGNDNNTLMMGDSRRSRKEYLRDFLTETHPGAVFNDLMPVMLGTALLFFLWYFIPIAVMIWLVWLGIKTLANHMRHQYLNKQEFLRRLKG